MIGWLAGAAMQVFLLSHLTSPTSPTASYEAHGGSEMLLAFIWGPACNCVLRNLALIYKLSHHAHVAGVAVAVLAAVRCQAKRDKN